MTNCTSQRTDQQVVATRPQHIDSTPPQTNPPVSGSSRSSSISDPPTPPPQYIESLTPESQFQISVEKTVSVTQFDAQAPVTQQLIVTRRLQHKSATEQQQGQPMESSASTSINKQAREDHCDVWCSCRCHAKSSLKTAVSANRIIGSLSVASQGISTGKIQCNQHACRRRPHPSLKVTYRPPPWLSNQYLAFSIRCRPSYGPEINVKLPRIVGWENPLWGHAINGNVVAIKDMFVKGLASPWDVNGLGGSPLHVGVARIFACMLVLRMRSTVRSRAAIL